MEESERFMREALLEAEKALAAGEVPKIGRAHV